MCGLSVNVQLVVLVIVDEAAALLEYREVSVVSLRQKVEIIPMRELRTDLNGLPVSGMEPPDGVDVGPVALLAALAQPRLGLAEI